MRTTLVLDDDVARAARHRAVEEGITLGELVTRALRDLLRERRQPAAGVRLPRYGDPTRAAPHSPEALADFLAEQELAE